MKNTLTDLNNVLFVMLDRLMDDDICNNVETTTMEINRVNAGISVARQIVDINNTQLQAVKVACEWNVKTMPATMGIDYK